MGGCAGAPGHDVARRELALTARFGLGLLEEGPGRLREFSADRLERASETLEVALPDVLVQRTLEELIGVLEELDEVVSLQVKERIGNGAALDLVDHLLKLDQALPHAPSMPREGALLEPHT